MYFPQDLFRYDRCAQKNFGQQLLSCVLQRAFKGKYSGIPVHDEKTENMGREYDFSAHISSLSTDQGFYADWLANSLDSLFQLHRTQLLHHCCGLLTGSFLALLGVDRLEHFGYQFPLERGVTENTLMIFSITKLLAFS